jgi:hypothetical protein
MSQLTVYMDPEIMKKIERAARSRKLSISKWVRQELNQALETAWPVHYFDVFGSLKESDLSRPDQASLECDAPREDL